MVLSGDLDRHSHQPILAAGSDSLLLNIDEAPWVIAGFHFYKMKMYKNNKQFDAQLKPGKNTQTCSLK